MKHPAGTRHLTARRAALAALILAIAAAAAAAFSLRWRGDEGGLSHVRERRGGGVCRVRELFRRMFVNTVAGV